MKKSELQALVNEEIESLYSFIDDKLKIPSSFSREDCLSYFFVRLAEGSESCESYVLEREKAKGEKEMFDRLCQSVPLVPVRCLQAISMALGSLAALHDLEGRFIRNNESEVIQTLMVVNYARGIAANEFTPMESQAVLVGMLITRKRTHHLSHAIEAAKKRCSDSTETGGVWAALVDMARLNSHGLRGVTPKGMWWSNLKRHNDRLSKVKRQLTRKIPTPEEFSTPASNCRSFKWSKSKA